MFFASQPVGTFLLAMVSIALLVQGCRSGKELGTVSESSDTLTTDMVDTPESRSLFIRGVTALHMNDLDLAERYLTEAYAYLHNSPGMNYTMATLSFAQQDHFNAIYYGEKATELEPENKWYRLLLVQSNRATGNYQEVRHQLEAILEQNPGDLDMLLLKARIQNERGDYTGSNKTYQQILNRTGPDRSIYFQRINNYSRMDDHDGVVRELNKIITLDQGNINTLLMLAQFYLEHDRTEEAQETLEEAIQRDPRHPETLINLADIHISRHEWDKAGALLNGLVADSLVSTENKFEIVQYILSRFSNDLNNESLRITSESLIDILLQSEPDHGLSYALAAEFYMLTEDFEKAAGYLHSTIEVMPQNEGAWRQLVQNYYVEGMYDEAIHYGLKANQHVPDDAFIHFFIGGSYYLKDDHLNAITWLSKAKKLPSRSLFRSVIFGTLGDIYATQDDWDNAAEAYESAIELNSENDVALNNYAYYLSERDERLDEAKDLASKALELNPDNGAFLDTMGWIHFKLGNFEQAHMYIRRAIETGDISAEVLEHMGDVYDKLGEPDKALYWWKKALDEDETREHLKERLHVN